MAGGNTVAPGLAGGSPEMHAIMLGVGVQFVEALRVEQVDDLLPV